MGKVISGRASLSTKTGLSAVWTVKLGHTGRSVQGNEGYRLAVEWACVPDREKLLSHDASSKFCRLLAEAPRFRDFEHPFFRGRGITGEPPRENQMGPPPADSIPTEGRYHRRGDHVLYLADSEDGVRLERQSWHREGLPYVQRYRLPSGGLCIADFAIFPAGHFIASVFAVAEDCNVNGRQGPPNFIFSQVIAGLVAAKFDGMRVPGVCGAPGFNYCNLVLFKPHPAWPSWLEPRATPFPLSL